MPAFFVPAIEPDQQEAEYQRLAEAVGGGLPNPSERIYSMTWRHNGVEWTATVGEQLRGTEIITIGKGRDKREREVPRRSSDTVSAIFPGLPYLITHDGHSRTWNWPILAGEPIRVINFD